MFARVSLLGSDDLESIQNSRFGKYKIKLLSSIDGLVGISEAITASSTHTNYIGNLYHIPNGVDTTFYKPIKNIAEKKIIRHKFGLERDVFIASFSGAFVARKGFDFLIKSWEIFLQTYPDSVLLLIGFEVKYDQAYDSNFFERAKSYITNMDNYRFIDTNNIREYLVCSDLFIFPSLNEGVPNALNEAKASGLPVLVRKREWVTDSIVENGKDGVVVDSDSCEFFAKAITSLAENRAIMSKYGATARNKVENHIEISQIANKYLKMFLKNHTGGSGCSGKK